MAKKKQGDGSVFQRKDGRWEGRIVVGYKENGYAQTKNVTAHTKTECQEKLAKLREECGRRSEKIKPHIAALAGFVPCALSGTIILLRFESPLDKWYFLITCKLVYSPCAPAAGSRDISSIPVISARDFAASYMTSSEPCTVDAGCSGSSSSSAYSGSLSSVAVSFPAASFSCNTDASSV